MIKATELRIGNITNKGQIIAFYESGIHVGYGRCYRFSELEPITLTPEILLKAGFTNYDEQKWEKGHIILICYADGVTYLSNSLHVNVFYFHQLQNLVHALTGNELEINL